MKVPTNVNFLNEWTGFELPRGIVNKGITGCGATTLAIEDEHKSIICSPRINLIKNKCQQHKGTLAVYGDVRNGDIEDYLRNSPKPKLLATYDSVPRLNGLIKDRADWRVVVDEYQYLLISVCDLSVCHSYCRQIYAANGLVQGFALHRVGVEQCRTEVCQKGAIEESDKQCH